MTRFILIVAILVLALCNLVPRTSAQVNVTQKNNNPSRDGLYIDPAFTPGNAANLARDLNFNGTIVGNVHAQPLYIEGGPDGPMIIVVTASNNIYALNATTGTVIWQRNDIGPPVTSGLPCGNINPFGIIGTPVVDLVSRRPLPGGRLAVPSHQRAVGPEGLLAGDLLLEDRGHQRLDDAPGARHAPAGEAARGERDLRVVGHEPLGVVVGTEHRGHRLQHPLGAGTPRRRLDRREVGPYPQPQRGRAVGRPDPAPDACRPGRGGRSGRRRRGA